MAKIGRYFGVHYTTVSWALRKYEVRRRPRIGFRVPLKIQNPKETLIKSRTFHIHAARSSD